MYLGQNSEDDDLDVVVVGLVSGHRLGEVVPVGHYSFVAVGLGLDAEAGVLACHHSPEESLVSCHNSEVVNHFVVLDRSFGEDLAEDCSS